MSCLSWVAATVIGVAIALAVDAIVQPPMLVGGLLGILIGLSVVHLLMAWTVSGQRR